MGLDKHDWEEILVEALAMALIVSMIAIVAYVF